jgi:hypothetical protein
MAKAPKPSFLKGDEWYDFNQKFVEADDRSCVILVAAYLDNCTHELLIKVAKDPKPLIEKLLGDSQPLGSFSSRIDLLRSFGWISEVTHKDLHLIRNIRNKFAHDLRLHSFSDNPVRQWCQILEYGLAFDDNDADEPLRSRFLTSAFLCLHYLERVIDFLEHGYPMDALPAFIGPQRVTEVPEDYVPGEG